MRLHRPDPRAAKGEAGHGRLLGKLLAELGQRLGCVALHLDHDPPLGGREKIRDASGKIVGYKPDANDPAHLIYREKVAHVIKTNVRGDHGQHPDRVLIKRQRRRERAGDHCIKGRNCFCQAPGSTRDRRRCGNWRPPGSSRKPKWGKRSIASRANPWPNVPRHRLKIL